MIVVREFWKVRVVFKEVEREEGLKGRLWAQKGVYVGLCIGLGGVVWWKVGKLGLLRDGRGWVEEVVGEEQWWVG